MTFELAERTDDTGAPPALRRPTPITLDEACRLGEILATSGYFEDTKGAAQAVVKILAGAEQGIPPIAAMANLYITNGKPTATAALIAERIKSHPELDYRITEHTREACEIEILERGEKVGTSRYTIQDARDAGLAGKVQWKAHPRNMLFARAITNAYRFYCPHVFGAPVYAVEEFDDETPPVDPVVADEPALHIDETVPDDEDVVDLQAVEPLATDALADDQALTLEQAERLLGVIRDRQTSKRQLREALATVGITQPGDDLEAAIRRLTLGQATELFEAITSSAEREEIGDARDLPWNATPQPA